MNNQSSYCGLVNAKIRASDKDLPVCPTHYYMHTEFSNLPMTLQHSHSLPARLNWMASLRGRTQPRKRRNVGCYAAFRQRVASDAATARWINQIEAKVQQDCFVHLCTFSRWMRTVLIVSVQSLYRSIYSPL